MIIMALDNNNNIHNSYFMRKPTQRVYRERMIDI